MNSADGVGGEQLEWGWGKEEERKNFSSSSLSDADRVVEPTASVAGEEGFGISEFIRDSIIGNVVGGTVEGVVEGLFNVDGT